MRWWLECGVDGFRMDVINLISKGSGPARRNRPRRRLLRSRPPLLRAALASTTTSPRCTARSSTATPAGCSPSARCPASRWRRPSLTDPARRELDMAFQFGIAGPDQAPAASSTSGPRN
ncbi:hypothetical protein LV779_15860 [Streptomyces thinghirensis]|nr:hypothetical protein [Streptomyces thinghirensis]